MELLNFELTTVERINLLEKSHNPLDAIQSVAGMYSFSGARMYQDYLEKMVTSSNLSSLLKAEASKSLFDFEEFLEVIKEDEGDEVMKEIKRESNEAVKERNKKRKIKAYETLAFLCERFDTSISTPYKVELITRLMMCHSILGDYYDEAFNSFKRILSNDDLEVNYRYKMILTLEKNTKIEQKERYIKDSLAFFIKAKTTPVRYVILGIQNLLQNYIVDVKSRMRYEVMLLEIGRNEGEEYNTRADACDTLINVGTTEVYKEEAKNILLKLGNIGGRVAKTVYDNAQNVHNTKIEESSLNVIRFLLNVDSGKTDLEGVLKEIEGEVEGCSQEKKDRIKVSLNRLVIDRSYYHNTSLSTILIKVWSYIEAKKEEDQKKELKKRLLEELDEMSGTCSSGFLLRLLNTLSGFEDQATLSISFEDQIVSNFVGRLNGYAKKIGESTSVFYEKERLKEVVKLVKGGGGEGKDVVVDEMTFEEKEKVVTEFGENVLMELCEDTSQWGKRTNFLLFFRTYLPVLQKELYEEFKSYLTDSEIDLYIRKAISTYEGVKFMT
jgi:hypothetical protein